MTAADHLKHGTAQGPHIRGLSKLTAPKNFWRPECGREKLQGVNTVIIFAKSMSQRGGTQLLLHGKNSTLLNHSSIIITTIVYHTEKLVVGKSGLS